MNRLAVSVIFGLVTINTVMLADPSHPRLVVGIVVDQLRTDYIEHLKDQFGEKGFRRLIKEGAYIKDVEFGTDELDAVNATALLYTGSYPVSTGVPSARIYNAETGKQQLPLSDPSALGNFTDDSFSPASLRLSTLSDEVVMGGNGLGRAYGFSADPQQAVIMAGHAGASACWINENTGNWATSTYYRQIPSTVSLRNYSNSLSSRIDTIQWRQGFPADHYPSAKLGKKNASFRHYFPRSERDVYKMYTSSPLVNSEVTDVAIECLKTLNIGTSGDSPEMLSVAYTVAPYRYGKNGNTMLEQEDSYLRLDAQIGRLLDAVDNAVGAGNAIVWLSSTGYYEDSTPVDPKFKIPTGEFSAKRAKSLLNSYLAAQYGNGDYVETFVDGHIYLNHKLIEEKRLDAQRIIEDSRALICRMSGIRDAYTIQEILSGNERLEPLRRVIDPRHGGDVIVTLSPGWKLVDDVNYPPEVKLISDVPVMAPAFIVGGGVRSQVISTPVEATALAPTVAGLLRIRSPNGAVSKPLLLE